MTSQDHLELYEELKQILFNKNITLMTEAQKYFTLSLETASFDNNFLAMYSELVDKTPSISLRNLHAFCLGYALSKSIINVETNETNH